MRAALAIALYLQQIIATEAIDLDVQIPGQNQDQGNHDDQPDQSAEGRVAVSSSVRPTRVCPDATQQCDD